MLANLTMTEVVPTFPARFTETDGRRIPPKLWHHLTPSPLAMPSPDKTQHRRVYMYSRYQRTGYGVKEWWVMIINATEHQWSVLFRGVYSVMSETLTALVYKAFESNTYMHINVILEKWIHHSIIKIQTMLMEATVQYSNCQKPERHKV